MLETLAAVRSKLSLADLFGKRDDKDDDDDNDGPSAPAVVTFFFGSPKSNGPALA